MNRFLTPSSTCSKFFPNSLFALRYRMTSSNLYELKATYLFVCTFLRWLISSQYSNSDYKAYFIKRISSWKMISILFHNNKAERPIEKVIEVKMLAVNMKVNCLNLKILLSPEIRITSSKRLKKENLTKDTDRTIWKKSRRKIRSLCERFVIICVNRFHWLYKN